ncbi:MAG: hypothetical protein M0P70_13665 [Desulfobulbaceae bacterium]|jgi:hypothetical protein|nr:hypothetical protein [Desulfobulbaceae bacterium]
MSIEQRLSKLEEKSDSPKFFCVSGWSKGEVDAKIEALGPLPEHAQVVIINKRIITGKEERS